MLIANDCVVSIDYTLKDSEGEVIDASEGSPLSYLHGHKNIVPGLERALTGKGEKETISVVLPPEEGYGQRDPSRVFPVRRELLPDGMEPTEGTMLRMETDDGDGIPVVITAVESETVTVDANHMLAGETLHFEVTVREVRSGTDEEISHGHVHGPEGHDH